MYLGMTRASMHLDRLKAMFGSVLVALTLSCGEVTHADVPQAQVAEVEHLIGYLASSECQMVRNGKAYSGWDGAKHVQRKYDHFRDKIDSTEEFIALAASKSLRSGRAYEVRCPGQPAVPSSEWLLQELRAFRKTP